MKRRVLRMMLLLGSHRRKHLLQAPQQQLLPLVYRLDIALSYQFGKRQPMGELVRSDRLSKYPRTEAIASYPSLGHKPKRMYISECRKILMKFIIIHSRAQDKCYINVRYMMEWEYDEVLRIIL